MKQFAEVFTISISFLILRRAVWSNIERRNDRRIREYGASTKNLGILEPSP